MKILKKKPNIVFVLTDDQGAWAMGCAGNQDVKTPNLDRLVRGKVILQPHGKEFFTWYSKHLFTLHGKHFFT